MVEIKSCCGASLDLVVCSSPLHLCRSSTQCAATTSLLAILHKLRFTCTIAAVLGLRCDLHHQQHYHHIIAIMLPSLHLR